MAKLTVPVKNEVLRVARKYAREQGTTLDRLVSEHLAELTGLNARRRIAREQLSAVRDGDSVGAGPVARKRRKER